MSEADFEKTERMGVMTGSIEPTSTMNRFCRSGLYAGLLFAAVTGAVPAMAADLPFFPAGSNQFQSNGPPPFFSTPPRNTFGGLLPEQRFAGPPRYDINGQPIYGTVFTAAPGPLYASTGCPAALQPVYDSVGNFAGYSAIQMCR